MNNIRKFFSRFLVSDLLIVNRFGLFLFFLHFSAPFAITHFAGADILGSYSILKNEMNLWVALGALGVFHFLLPLSGLYRLEIKSIQIILWKILILSILFYIYRCYTNSSFEFIMIGFFFAMLIYLLSCFCRSLFISSLSAERTFYYSYGFFICSSVALVVFRPISEDQVNILFFGSAIFFFVTLLPSMLNGIRNYLSVSAVSNYSTGQMYLRSIPYVAKDSLQLFIIYFLFSSLKVNTSIAEVGYFSILVTYPAIVCFLIASTAPKIVSKFALGQLLAGDYFFSQGLISLILVSGLGLVFTLALFLEVEVFYKFIPQDLSTLILIYILSIAEAVRSMFVTYLYGRRMQSRVLVADLVPFIFVSLFYFSDLITNIPRALSVMIFYSVVSLAIQLRSVDLSFSSGSAS